MIKIERVNNGWILTSEEEKLVFSYNDDDIEDTRKDEIETFIRLLQTLNEKIGAPYSKHERYNLDIKII